MSDRCIADRYPQEAIDAMVLAASTLKHDDGHTDCYYAGLLTDALAVLMDDEPVSVAELHSSEMEDDACLIRPSDVLAAVLTRHATSRTEHSS